MSINDLPPDILKLILDFTAHADLFQCAFVNSHFYTATIPILWRVLDLTHTERFARFSASLALTKKNLGHYCRDLLLEKIKDEDLLFCMERMPFLEVLDIRDSKELGDTSVSRLPGFCKQLKKLSLENTAIKHRSAHHLGRCTQLRELAFHNCQHLMPMSLLPFADCPLETLDLAGCKWLSDEDTAIDLHAFHQLKHLGLICCQKLSSRFIECLTETSVAMPDLRFISLTGSTRINDNAIIPFLQSHPHLESVHLLQCAITDKTLHTIKNYLPNIRAIDVSYCPHFSAGAIRKLIRACPHLMMIGLRECALRKSFFEEIEVSDMEEDGYDGTELIDSLGYFELEQIRSAPELDEQARRSPPSQPQTPRITQNPVDPLTESYTYIQEYLNRV